MAETTLKEKTLQTPAWEWGSLRWRALLLVALQWVVLLRGKALPQGPGLTSGGLTQSRCPWEAEAAAFLVSRTGSQHPSHALGADYVGAGGGRQVGGEDHPQGAARAAPRGFLGALPVSHQPHEQLVGPGDAEGRSQALPRGSEAETGQGHSQNQGAPPTALCPCPWPLTRALCPVPPRPRSPGRWVRVSGRAPPRGRREGGGGPPG